MPMYGKKPLQYCKVISLKRIKINEKKKKKKRMPPRHSYWRACHQPLPPLKYCAPLSHTRSTRTASRSPPTESCILSHERGREHSWWLPPRWDFQQQCAEEPFFGLVNWESLINWEYQSSPHEESWPMSFPPYETLREKVFFLKSIV